MPGKDTENPNAQISRRNVLLASALVVHTPLLGSARTADHNEDGNQPAEPRQPQYRETPHVRMFYDRSRF